VFLCCFGVFSFSYFSAFGLVLTWYNMLWCFGWLGVMVYGGFGDFWVVVFFEFMGLDCLLL